MKYVRNLDFFETPDYDFLRKMLRDLYIKKGYPDDGVFEWTGRNLAVTPCTCLLRNVEYFRSSLLAQYGGAQRNPQDQNLTKSLHNYIASCPDLLQIHFSSYKRVLFSKNGILVCQRQLLEKAVLRNVHFKPYRYGNFKIIYRK